RIDALPRLRVVLALGRIAHDATLAALGFRRSAAKFAHGAMAELDGRGRPIVLADSYHCSRYNMNTGRLTVEMFDAVLADVRGVIAR
ncbi:MAG: uracil-DNA glycosylase, partial [Caulobacterales bacterium]|nr:uracil-DNA glycosylase [Caulobacterales bacterium]